MKKIIIHWTAGTYIPNEHEKKCYHFLVDKNGKIYTGFYPPEANLVCRNGKYAMHTGGGNTNAIGVSMCAMAGFVSPKNTGKYPITPKQFEACMKLCADLSRKYNIEITPQSVQTHYEFGLTHPDTTSAGKIDIIYLPPYPWVTKNDIGRFIRSKIKWYRQKGE